MVLEHQSRRPSRLYRLDEFESAWHGPLRSRASARGSRKAEDLRVIQALRKGVPPDFDVYDAATWSVISALSEESVADRSRPVDVLDFTRGKWKSNAPVEITV